MSDTVTLHCEGYSNDTFSVEGVNGCGISESHDNCASGKPIAFRISQGDEAMLVVGQYAPGAAGGWLIGVAPVDSGADDQAIPAWPMRFEHGDANYSPRLVITAPKGVRVKRIAGKGT